MDVYTWFLVVLAAGSVACALAGWRWAPALPLTVAVLGGLLFATSEPTPSSGGDVSPGRLVGFAAVVIAVPLTVVCWAVVGFAEGRRQRRSLRAR